MQSRFEMNSAEIPRILGTVGSPLIVITELIKNSIDADASTILIQYNRSKKLIIVSDNGNGFSLEDIQNISKPGFSLKKRNGNLCNPKGFYFTGSKGLGLLSTFSLCENVEITTYSKNLTGYGISIFKETGEVVFRLLEEKVESPKTTISLVGVKDEIFDLLTSESELRKLRHISTYLYQHQKKNFPSILLQIDNQPAQSLLYKTNFLEMMYDVEFKYIKNRSSLIFKCSSPNKNINSETIELNNYDIANLENIALEYYNIKDTIKTRTNDVSSIQSYEQLNRVPSFEGKILVYEKQNAGQALKTYGAGVNIYVNDFALYNYLSEENDWLGLADFSQRKKNTRVRPHNVFGYVNFPEFDEYNEELKISNERADFIQDNIYVKFMYLLKGVIMYFLFNIDVADKNPKYKLNGAANSDIKNDEHEDDTFEIHPEPEDNKYNNENKTNKENKDKYSDDVNDPNKEKEYSYNNERGESYESSGAYKPRQQNYKKLVFTQSEGELINSLKDVDDLGNKIYELVLELSRLDVQSYRYAVVGLYRSLIESSTRYAAKKYPNSIKIDENNLADSVISILNYWNGIYRDERTVLKNINAWREIVNKRHLIMILNQYIHQELPVDIDFIQGSWNTIKAYIIQCLRS